MMLVALTLSLGWCRSYEPCHLSCVQRLHKGNLSSKVKTHITEARVMMKNNKDYFVIVVATPIVTVGRMGNLSCPRLLHTMCLSVRFLIELISMYDCCTH